MSFCHIKVIPLFVLSMLTIFLSISYAAHLKSPLPPIIDPLLLKTWSVSEKKTVEFAVFSDPHLYNTSLGVGGSAWDTYLAGDRKLLAESEALLSAAVDKIIDEHPDFVLVPGDLTKDGEKISHQLFASYMAKLEEQGIEVFVIPGNHDIDNPDAVSYSGDTTTAVDSITASEFSSIYANYGYNQAFARDENSLSYVAKVNSKLWILGLDSCRYEENDTEPVTGGRLKEATIIWAEDILAKANASGARVIAMMHHGLMEHYTGQASDGIGNDYVLADYTSVGQRLAEAGLRNVFTGHFHAQDIASTTFTLTDSTQVKLFDMETGSLVTYPNPYRLATLSPDGHFTSETYYIDTIDKDLAPDSDWDPENETFSAYSKSFLEEGLSTLATTMLESGYGLSSTEASTLAPYVANAFEAHYAGNEEITTSASTFIDYLSSTGETLNLVLASMLTNLWTDPGEDDLTRNGDFAVTVSD